ncbi:ABC-2 type transport system permease protein [Paenibacillus eucommiae]|uniref:ABC-2 type transport system permease protein n=1 Tax=Paenibacillus eucommiae TaxID=1355755 RepID=A0ABS4J5B4_9BACL|nr:ABC-2 type transport system permease protein [Paenibacillus eucommiae]
MLSLVQNENMKIYRRMRTWILLVLLIVFCCLVSFIDHYDKSNSQGGDWRASLQQSIQDNQAQLASPDLPEFIKEQMEDSIKISQHSLDNNIPPVQNTMWGGVMTLSGLVQIITLFTVIIAGDMVASEFTWGTIKLLLIRPASRTKILFSKYVSTLLFSLLLLLVLFLSAILVNGILYGFQDVGLPYLSVGANGVVQESSMPLHVFGTYALKLVELVMVVTLAFMISTVFRSSSLAIGFSIFIMLAGQLVTLFLMRYSWGKYYLFANTDLTQYLEGGRPLIEGMTMGFSIAVLAVYFVLFNVLSWIIFKKRDVAA